MTNKIKIALFRSSSKPFETRLPIYPSHIDLIDSEIKSNLYIEKTYSAQYGYLDGFYTDKIHLEERDLLLSSSDCCFFVRPTYPDLELVKPGATVVGWFHCVQNQIITKLAVNKKLTLICMEGLFKKDGSYFFEENSRITGRQAINYTLRIADRMNKINQKVTVIGHGSAGTSSIKELQKLGFKNIICLSRRNKTEILDIIESVQYLQIKHDFFTKSVKIVDGLSLLDILSDQDIIVNATTQDIYNPVFFLKFDELSQLKKEALIIDISCDSQKMSFDFSNITSFDRPIIKYGNVSYCAIDHLPTLESHNATKEISSALLTILPSIYSYLIKGKGCDILEAAIQIKNGHIINPDIIYYRDQLL